MKMIKVLCVLMVVYLMGATLSQAADITAPGNPVLGLPDNGDWPAGEAPLYAIDNNVNTKYLHGGHDTNDPSRITGIRIAPALKGKVVGGLTFTTANDSAERDPRNFVLKGTNDSRALNDPDNEVVWTTIATGTITDFGQTDAWPRYTMNATPILFNNTTPYDYYEIKFPNLRDDGAGLMQIAEIELLERPANGWSPTVNAGIDRMIRMPNLSVDLTPAISDIDSTSFTVTWTKISGPGAVTFTAPQSDGKTTATFPAIDGLYALNCKAVDNGGNDANDVVVIKVWNPANDKLLAQWKMNEGAGLVANDSTTYNDRGTLGHFVDPIVLYGDPNWIPGWIPADGANNFALDFRSMSYVEVLPDANDVVSAALCPEWSMSISAWIKPADWDGNRRIIQKGAGDNQYRLLADGGVLNFDVENVGNVTCPLPLAGMWHFVAATYDGSAIKLYVDGMETATQAAMGQIGVTADPLYIGTKGATVAVAGDYFKGSLEDVRISNYPLSLDEVKALAAAGENSPPVIVTVVQPADLALSVRNYIDMQSTVFDVNNDTIIYAWTASDPSVTFNDGGIANPRATFTKAGVFTLRLTINDGKAGLDGSIYKEVTVNVISPTCADVIKDGKLMAADLNKDCAIDLEDFAILAGNWLDCNDPMDANCVNPYAGPMAQ